MSAKWTKFILVAGLITVFVCPVAAQDWPQWRGPNRDGKVADFEAPEKWPAELVKKWSVTVGIGDSTPSLVGDKLFVFARQGEQEVNLCLNAADGKELWRDAYEAMVVTGPPSRHPGPRSSPTVADGKVLTIGVGGVLSCLDAASGKLLWRKDPFHEVVPEFFTSMSPLIVNGMAVAHLGGKGNGALIAYDISSGEEKWRWAGEGPEYASPALLDVEGTKQIVTLTEKSVAGIGLADGKLLWSIPFVPGRREYNAATPVIDGQVVYYTGAGRGVHAVKIVKQGEAFEAEELWSNPDVAPQYNTPVLKDGFLYGLSNRGNLFCVNTENGTTGWMDETSYDRSGFTSIVDVGDVLLALPSSAELLVYKPSSEAYAEVARIKVAETAVYAHPVIAGSRIYIKDAESLTLWTLD